MKNFLFVLLLLTVVVLLSITGCKNLPGYTASGNYTVDDLSVDPYDARKEILPGYRDYAGKVVKISPMNGVNWVDYSRSVYWSWDRSGTGYHEITISLSVMIDAPEMNKALISAYKPSRGIWRSPTAIERKGPGNIGWTLQSFQGSEEITSQFGGTAVEIPAGQWVDLEFTQVVDISEEGSGQVYIDGHNDEQGLVDLTLYIRHFKVTMERTDRSLIALTFNGSPSDITHTILDKLEEMDVKASFFVTGMNIDALNPATDKTLTREEREQMAVDRKETVKRIFENGHDLANLSYSHNYLGGGKLNGSDTIDSGMQPRDIPILLGYSVFSYPLSEDVIHRELEDTQVAIQKAIYGEQDYLLYPWASKFSRLPFGSDPDEAVNFRNIAREMDLPVIAGGGGNSGGSPKKTAEELADEIIRGSKPWGVCVYQDTSSDTEVVKFLDILIPGLKEQGYEFVSLTKMIEKRGKALIPGNAYDSLDPALP